MRLWTLHPRYLDPQGLVALWREALLAQHVLDGRTRGYRQHPQLHRFRESPDPLAAIASYLVSVHGEATARGYSFNVGLISRSGGHPPIEATTGQIDFEARHLRNKLAARSPHRIGALGSSRPDAHPLFHVVSGPVEPWERPSRRAAPPDPL